MITPEFKKYIRGSDKALISSVSTISTKLNFRVPVARQILTESNHLIENNLIINECTSGLDMFCVASRPHLDLGLRTLSIA
jgi:hypothetical protein